MLDFRETLVSHRVFIVDDDLDKASQYKSILETNGFVVNIFFRFEDVLDNAITLKPDLIFLDLLIPNQDGFRLCQNLKQHPVTHDIPVVFLTKLGDMNSIHKGINMGAADYLLKATTNPPKLLDVTRKHLVSMTARYHAEI
jgi:PleD family two-component response regulator